MQFVKVNLNDLVFDKKQNVNGKVVYIDYKNKTAKVEVIVDKNEKEGTRTTKLVDCKLFNLAVIEHAKKKRTKRSPKRDTLYFAKVKPEAIIPTKRDEDGCYDVYVLFDEDEVIINPHEIKTFSTGIATAVSHKYRLDFQRERGSTGSIGLVPRCGQVDSGYRGEVFLKLQNTTEKPIVISKLVKEKEEREDAIYYPHTKAVCQFAVEIVPEMEEKEISYEELLAIPSERGTGALGSSGK